VLAQISSTPQERKRTADAPRREPGRWRTWVASSAAAVLFAAGVGGGTWALTRQHYTSQSSQIDAVLAAADARLVSQEVEGGRVTMVFSPSRDAGVAVLSNLKQPAGSYQLWMVDSSARSVGYTEQGSGRFYIKGLAPVFGLSKERKGGSTTPHDIVSRLNLG
jgi:hypothetical protein